MDYDKVDIAERYDSGRGYDPEVLHRWLTILSTHVPRDRIAQIVDLGCGTGRYSEALATHFSASVLGIDPSEKMLEQARQKESCGRVAYKQALGENLPIGDESTDMVFMSMVLHHLPDPRCTALECHRVLRQRGYVCLRNGTVDAIETFPYLTFFPSIRRLIQEQLPSRGLIKNIFEEAGFQINAHQVVTHQLSADWTSFAEKVSRRSDSFLVRIADDEFHRGMAGLREFANSTDCDGPVTEDVDFFVFQR